VFTPEERDQIQQLRDSQSAPWREVQRARILWRHHSGESIVENSTPARDPEYKRLGACSILAALDLHSGHVTARVERRHRSRELISLLKDLNGYYPAECTIRLILDNHSAHISQETREFLTIRPNRFKYVLTPTHGSWLNIVETLFGKTARRFLRHIRVQSWEELRDRILKGVEEINADPVVHRWKKFEALTSG
jgi:transposase